MLQSASRRRRRGYLEVALTIARDLRWQHAEATNGPTCSAGRLLGSVALQAEALLIRGRALSDGEPPGRRGLDGAIAPAADGPDAWAVPGPAEAWLQSGDGWCGATAGGYEALRPAMGSAAAVWAGEDTGDFLVVPGRGRQGIAGRALFRFRSLHPHAPLWLGGVHRIVHCLGGASARGWLSRPAGATAARNH